MSTLSSSSSSSSSGYNAIITPRFTLRRLMKHWSYNLFGPTTLHLQFEFFLLVSLTLLTASSLQSLYKESFGLPGDYIYLLLVFLWLSRYLLLRWLCAWDPSTSKNPTLIGLLSNILTSHVIGGQTFDRPNQQIITKYVGGGGSTSLLSQSSRTLSFSKLLPGSLLYFFQMVRVRIWYPVATRLASLSRFCTIIMIDCSILAIPFQPLARQLDAKTKGLQNWFKIFTQYCYSFWATNGPTLSFLLPTAVIWLYLFKIFFILYATPTAEQQSSQQSTTTITTLTSRTPAVIQEEEEASKAYGAYTNVQRPRWWCSQVQGGAGVLFYMTVVGTMVSLLFYFRIFLPIPDQVAGGNAIKDLRTEARSSGGSSGGGGGSGSSSGGGGKSSKGGSRTIQRDSQDAVWTERMHSITVQNRFRLTFHVRAIRMFEAIFLCGILPRTSYICRAIGHCPEGAQIWELTSILYPAGINSPLRKDGMFSFGTIAVDRTAAIWTILGISAVSLILSLAQTVVLNKTYLAIMAYISSEWDPVRESEVSTTTPPVWDPRRRYKKGDLVLFPPNGPRQSVYRATSNSPEGKPSEPELRMEQELMRKELGHPSTSNLLWMASHFQSSLTLLHGVILLCCKLLGYKANGMFTMLCAHLVVNYALLSIGMPDYKAAHRLNEEISKGL